MAEKINFYTTDEIRGKINDLVKDNIFSTQSACINAALNLFFKDRETQRTVDFLQYITLPLFFLIVTIGLSLYIVNIFFYILACLAGIYMMIFIYMYYSKYKSLKWE